MEQFDTFKDFAFILDIKDDLRSDEEFFSSIWESMHPNILEEVAGCIENSDVMELNKETLKLCSRLRGFVGILPMTHPLNMGFRLFSQGEGLPLVVDKFVMAAQSRAIVCVGSDESQSIFRSVVDLIIEEIVEGIEEYSPFEIQKEFEDCLPVFSDMILARTEYRRGNFILINECEAERLRIKLPEDTGYFYRVDDLCLQDITLRVYVTKSELVGQGRIIMGYCPDVSGVDISAGYFFCPYTPATIPMTVGGVTQVMTRFTTKKFEIGDKKPTSKYYLRIVTK